MNRLVKFATNPWLLGITAALVIYSLIGFLLIPFLVQRYTPRIAADRLDRQASVGEVRFNPFLFTFEVKDFAFNEANGEPILGWQRLFVDFELESLFRWAWTFADLQLKGPSLNLVMDSRGTLNLARIAEDMPPSEEPPPPPDEAPPRFLLKHMALADGSVKFTDHSGGTTATETIDPINLQFDTVSTLPDRPGFYRVHAQLAQGGTLEWRGDFSLHPVWSNGEVRLERFNLATLWDFLRDRLNMAEPAGEIGFTARYRFSYDQGKTELSVNEMATTLKGLRLASLNGADPLLTLDEVALAGAAFDLASRAVKVPSFLIRNGQVNASVNERGEIDWQKLIKPEAVDDHPKPSRPAPEPQALWRITVENFKVADIGIAYADASRASPVVASIGQFGLDLKAEAELGAASPRARIGDLSAHLNRIALAERGKTSPLLTWDGLAVEGGRLDLEKREALIQRATLKGGGAEIIRQADGTLYPIALFVSETSAPSEESTTEADSSQEAKPWHFTLNEFTLQGFGVALADRSVSPEIAYHLDGIRVALKDISTDGEAPISFDAELKVRQGGALQASGTASQQGGTAKVRVDQINLQPMQPLIAQYAALKLENAELSADLQVDLKRGEVQPSVKATGGASVNGLLLNEAKSGERFLAWKTLSVHGIDFSLQPDKLSVKEVRIVEPGSTIEIFKDRTTNIAALFQARDQAPAKKPSAQTKASEQKAEKPFPVAVERIRIDNGVVDFSDMSLVIPFATRIHDFDGAVIGVSTARSDRAALQFEGRVDQYGQVKVDGSLNPLQHTTYSDIDVVFRNVDMPSLTPYSATFAGRKIQSGKLNMDLEYKIENHRLKSSNEIVLEQFTLGERVESPDAISLPLDLAIALLKDSEGKINASVPVEGNVDDPKFHYGKLVGDALVTLVKKIVSAPFRALASLFGGSEENISRVLFEPGQDTIPPPEREKLHKLAESLAQRPQLKLTVHGRFDPKLDGEALKSLQVRRALAQKQKVDLKPGEDPGPVAFGNGKIQRALEELAIERGGPKAVDEFQADYEKASGKQAERVSGLAAFFGMASKDHAFYEKLFQHLVDTAPLPETELQTLADRRAQAVVTELASQQKLDPARVAAGKIEPIADSKGENVPTRLELGAYGT